MNQKKYNELLHYLKELKSTIVAFSGGVDSSFLLWAAKEALGEKVKAVTLATIYTPRWELAEAKEFAQSLQVEHEIIEVEMPETIRFNPENRCYLCKKELFARITLLAERQGFQHVSDGTNFDDLSDYRPGRQALAELGVKSPLLACCLTKDEIRALSKEKGLATWDKPAYACLLTRLPYGQEVTQELLTRIEAAERYMMQLGFAAVRVRCHDELARIEVDRQERKKLFNEEIAAEISAVFKQLGFRYVTLDLDGYRMGSFNANQLNDPKGGQHE
ncbi:ATP-dependent sacrificial sulfur transferase LarE [Azotosporobacter soli]|uniref:ATP-dependent sacrificial sulfur transferase LarE n=1 Tax=Azotosporobacter soli TaxID=3055040 RepID=UPI0031FEA265